MSLINAVSQWNSSASFKSPNPVNNNQPHCFDFFATTYCAIMCSTRSIEITFDFVSRDDWIISNYHFSAQFSNPLESHTEINYYSRRSQQREDWEAFMRWQGFITISGIRVHTCWDVVYGVCSNFQKAPPMPVYIVDFKTFSILSSSQLHFITYNQQKIRMRKAGFS